MIEAKGLVFEYIERDEEGNATGVRRAVDNVSFSVKKGEFIAICGHNGSGKSTLAKHINALLFPGEGSIEVEGMDTCVEENILPIRQRVGMVFQNPDNQIVAGVVEEDVAFGPENLGVEPSEIRQRVDESLKTLDMYGFRDASPNHLSGGQKQRVAIAGVVAMHPGCIILDESTAMLDPSGRKEVIRAARALNLAEDMTVILITHYMDEVVYADRVFVMNEGSIVMSGSPSEVFSRDKEIEELGLTLPVVTKLALRLRQKGHAIKSGILTTQELAEALEAERSRL